MATYYKTCKKCGLEKEISNFNIRKVSKDGYRNECKSCSKLYNIDKNKAKETNKTWRKNNLDKLKKDYNKFLELNKDYQKNYASINRDKINIRNKKRRDNNPNFKVKENVRTLIKNSLKYKGIKKNQKSVEILGCSTDEFKQHLESKFESWMNWSNYGNPKDGILETNKTWDIDHIIPLSTAETDDDIIKLNHYTNLQPLCSYKNRITKRINFIQNAELFR